MSNNTYNLVVENPQSTVVAVFTPDKKRAEQYQSEAELERAFIEQLRTLVYDFDSSAQTAQDSIKFVQTKGIFPKLKFCTALA